MGKVKELLLHPDEILPMVWMYRMAKQAQRLPADPDLAFCFHILNSVSRSFAVVIYNLPLDLRNVICVFYLVLRALDTVEDDMSIPTNTKVSILNSFHAKIKESDFSLNYGTDYYKQLLCDFPKVHRVLMKLPVQQQEVICDVTKRMGEGMAEFIQKEVLDVDDYDKYCYYVAGLVGIGLSHLFALSSLETEEFRNKDKLSVHMGLSLQKTNIIRDYLEDINEEPAPRMFWPKDIWGLYAEDLEEFKDPANRQSALQCLNHMIVNAMQHIPFCFQYLEMIKSKGVFQFCAIPQVMSVATAALCFNNGRVFEGVVKLRRGRTCKIFQQVGNMADVYALYLDCVNQIEDKLSDAEMTPEVRVKAKSIVAEIQALCRAKTGDSSRKSFSWWMSLLVLIIGLLIAYYSYVAY